MNKGNFLRRTLSILILASILLFNAVSHAQIYSGESFYIMNDVENLEVAKKRAKADAIRNAAEKANIYVENYALSKNLELEEDFIETITVNILKLVEEPRFNKKILMIRAKVKVQIDDSDINSWFNKYDNEKSTLISQMKALRKADDEQISRLAELKRQLANNTHDKEKIAKKFAEEDKIFLSNQKVAEGWQFWAKKDFDTTKNLFDDAVKLNPDNSLAYFGLGTVNRDFGQFDNAIQNYKKAIELNPNDENAYYQLGSVYSIVGKYEQAIPNLDKVVEINPNNADAYNNLAFAYSKLGKYDLAIQNHDKAIELKPNDAVLYSLRGFDYYFSKKYELAIKDFNKYIELAPNDADGYKMRGFCYKELGDEEKAQADFKKAKEIGDEG